MRITPRVNTHAPTSQESGAPSSGQQPAPSSRSRATSPHSENLPPRARDSASPPSLRPRLSLQDLTGRISPTTTSAPAAAASTAPAAASSSNPVAAAAVSPTTTSAAPPARLEVNDPKGGNDKQWFPDPSGTMGWLQARDNGKVEAVRREVATIRTLASLGFPVAQIIDRPPPESITSNGANKPVQATGGGVWLANVDAVATKKPKALGHPIAGDMQTTRLVRELRKEEVDLPNLAQNLAALIPHVDELCRHVGEVDMAFTKDGRITLLDVAPADGGQVAAQDEQGVAHIKAGLQNLLAKLG